MRGENYSVPGHFLRRKGGAFGAPGFYTAEFGFLKYDRHSCLSASGTAIPRAGTEFGKAHRKRRGPAETGEGGLQAMGFGETLIDRQECLSYYNFERLCLIEDTGSARILHRSVRISEVRQTLLSVGQRHRHSSGSHRV
jgi:hypothetical protein